MDQRITYRADTVHQDDAMQTPLDPSPGTTGNRPATQGRLEEFLGDVQTLVSTRLKAVADRVNLPQGCLEGFAGKMLRPRLGARLVESGAADPERALAACAAVELLHTATLCHDDVIDGTTLRRHRPTLWKTTGTAAAILVGDLFLTESLLVLRERGDAVQILDLLKKMGEICEAELELEYRYRGRPLDEATWIRLGRAKTGALFAFVGRGCCADDPDLGEALEEAGYRLGTAYQVVDDLVDVVGTEAMTGKTAARDEEAGVLTPMTSHDDPVGLARKTFQAQCDHALEAVARWPAAANAFRAYLERDVGPLVATVMG